MGHVAIYAKQQAAERQNPQLLQKTPRSKSGCVHTMDAKLNHEPCHGSSMAL